MTRSLLLLLTLATGTALAFDGPPDGPPPRGEHHRGPFGAVDRLENDGQLDAETLAAVDALEDAHRETMSALRTEIHEAHRAFRDAMASAATDPQAARAAHAQLLALEGERRRTELDAVLDLAALLPADLASEVLAGPPGRGHARGPHGEGDRARAEGGHLGPRGR